MLVFTTQNGTEEIKILKYRQASSFEIGLDHHRWDHDEHLVIRHCAQQSAWHHLCEKRVMGDGEEVGFVDSVQLPYLHMTTSANLTRLKLSDWTHSESGVIRCRASCAYGSTFGMLD